MDERQKMDEINSQSGGTPKGGANRFWAGALAGALVTAFAGIILVGMSAGIYMMGRRVLSSQPKAPTEEASDSSQGLDFSRITTKLELLDAIIKQEFLYDENTERMEDYLYIGMVAGLNDPYSTYYSAEEFASIQEGNNGTYSGIGAMLSQDRTTGQSTIVKVFEGSPAYEAGMRPGDVVYQVGDVLASGESLDVLVSNYIKGKEGTPVTITVYRADTDEYVEMTMNRRTIEVPTVSYRMMDNRKGYIEVSEFDKVTVSQFQAAVDDLTAQGMTGLVLDLRNNPGGLLDSGVAMADYLLPDDLSDFERGGGKTLIVYTGDKNDKGETYTASDGHEVKVPIVVLINGSSASCSEVLTGALRDYAAQGRMDVTVVGTTSYGKGVVQSLIPLGDGSALRITTAHYYTPKGYDINEKGIEPDVEVDLKEELKTKAVVAPEEDNQLAEAVKVLEQAAE